jgi:hypothetical protein
MQQDGGSNHVCTWRIACAIDAVWDWLFAQVKTDETLAAGTLSCTI